MHSNRQSPEIPIFGNKVIGVMNGILDMHGVPRNPVWTSQDTTAYNGSSTITFISSVDWQVGETIVIEQTEFANTEAEEKIIDAINRANPNKPISPLLCKHYYIIQNLGSGKTSLK